MLPVDLPRTTDILELVAARSDASVSLYLESSPIPAEHERVRLSLRNAIDEAEAALASISTPRDVLTATIAPLRALDSDHEFWRHQASSLAIFAAEGDLHAFRLANRLSASVRVGDRFDVGALLRARTFPHGGYVLGLAVEDVHLWRISPDGGAHEIGLELPEDLGLELVHAENHGQADRQRAQGSLGDRPGRERWSRSVQETVLPHLDGDHPLLLAGTAELEPAYRAINTYPRLLEEGLDVHPAALDAAEAARRARALLDASYAAEVAAWRERQGNETSRGRATTSLPEVALAATVGQVSELRFDMDCDLEGEIDGDGVLQLADQPGPTTYAVVDEIAARVLAAGGAVYALRSDDLVDDSPVAAILRAPLEAIGAGPSS